MITVQYEFFSSPDEVDSFEYDIDSWDLVGVQ